jgi:hypothetical protein
VYAQCGGKQGLLRLLMESWTETPAVVESYQESIAADDAVLVMQTPERRLPPDHQAVGRRHPGGDRRSALLRTRDVFGWSLERSNKWLLANASAAVLR